MRLIIQIILAILALNNFHLLLSKIIVEGKNKHNKPYKRNFYL